MNPPLLLAPHTEICQSDYPLDWYPSDFEPYAREYLALPNRQYQTIIDWMEPYLRQAQTHFGDDLLLLAHYYMGGEIVKLIQHFGGQVGDSYELALMAAKHPEKKIIVESAVHFMAESISILAKPDQKIFITNPKAGCTMEMLAKDYMVDAALETLNARYGSSTILPLCYMNTSGRVKALAGRQGGSVCTSSNAAQIMRWACEQNKKIFFVPDKHLGYNAARWANIPKENIAFLPAGQEALNFSFDHLTASEQKKFDEAKVIIFASLCAVHDYYRPEMVEYWRDRGYWVIAHPECPPAVVEAAQAQGSTKLIWQTVTEDRAHTQRYAIATENHLVENLRELCAQQGITVVNVAEAKLPNTRGLGCGCATMSRNDPPHLVATLDLLRQGKSLEKNQVLPGDKVDEFTGIRQRLSEKEQKILQNEASLALQKMKHLVEER